MDTEPIAYSAHYSSFFLYVPVHTIEEYQRLTSSSLLVISYLPPFGNSGIIEAPETLLKSCNHFNIVYHLSW